MNHNKKYTISEYGLIGTNEDVESANKFLSAKVNEDAFVEIETFAKSDNGKEVFTFHSNGKYIRAKSYVGVIQTNSGYIIEILPKTAKDDDIEKSKEVFIALLHILYKLPNYKSFEDTHLSKIKNKDILEIFILMFVNEVNKLIKKGIKSDYISKEENLYYLKGKLMINQQIKHNYIHKERFYVNYDDYNQNRAENRLIKSTLNLLSSVSKDFENIRNIRQNIEHLGQIELSRNIDQDIMSIKNNRGMEHYKNALLWTKIFLKKETFSSFSGETISFENLQNIYLLQ
jgi:5-methylcytosine-specific restriction enzyme subunit McrC